MMYRALVLFTDSQDGDYRYQPGDKFPRDGKEVSEGRLAELASAKNKRGVPVIAKAAEPLAGRKAPEAQEAIKEPVATPNEGGPVQAPKRRRKRAD